MKLTIDRTHFVRPGPMGLMLSRLGQLVKMVERRNEELRLMHGQLETIRSQNKRIKALEEEITNLRRREISDLALRNVVGPSGSEIGP